MDSFNDLLKSTFRGPIPILTESFQYILALAVSMISASVIFSYTGIELDIMLALIFGVTLGVATQICLALFITQFYSETQPDSEMDEMLNKVLRQIEPVDSFDIWRLNSPSMFITPHISLFSKSLVISDTMQKRMKNLPEKAEIVLAERVLELNNVTRYVNLIFTTTLFTVSLLIHIYLIIPVLLIFGFDFLTILSGPLTFVIGGLFVMLVLFRGATWRRSRAFEIVHSMYQVHPSIAEKSLQENQELSPLVTEGQLIILRTNEMKSRSERMASIIILAVGFSGLLGLGLLPFVLQIIVFVQLITLMLPLLLIALLVSIIVPLFLIKRFDDRAIDRLYGKFDLKTEPIWND